METKLYGEIAPGGKWAALLLLGALAVYVPGLWTYELSDSESKYAEIPREMVESGDWVAPSIDYVPYLTKPPLTFWITSVAYKVGGVNPFTGRLPNAIFAIALAFVIGAIGRTLFGTRASTISTLLALTTAEFYVYTRECGVEMCLLFFTALVHHCFLRWQRTEKRKWLRGAWASAAAAVLAKGPIGILFPFLSIFIYLIVTGQRGQFRRIFSWVGVLCFLGIALPWPIAMGIRNPDFFWFAIVHETWYRIIGQRLPNDALFPTGRFLLLFLGEFYPWVQHVPHALGRAWKDGRSSYEGHCVAYLLAWAVVPLVVFSLSASKVDFYGLHSYPGLILLVAWLWDKQIAGGERAPSRVGMAMTFLVSGALAAASWCAVTFRPNAQWIRDLDLPPSDAVTRFLIIAMVGNFAAGVLLLKGRPRAALALITAMMLGFFAIAQVRFASLTEADSMHFATLDYRAAMGKGTVLVSDERPEFAHVAILPFYVKAPCYVLRNEKNSQLVFHDRDPRRHRVIDEAELVEWVHKGMIVFLVGEREKTEARLARLGLRYKQQSSTIDRAVYRIDGE